MSQGGGKGRGSDFVKGREGGGVEIFLQCIQNELATKLRRILHKTLKTFGARSAPKIFKVFSSV